MGMMDELKEQPRVLQRFLHENIAQIKSVANAIRDRAPRFCVLVARGTSDNAALYAKYLLGTVNKMVCASAAPSLWTLYDSGPTLSDSLVIGISQSGASTDLVRVMESARRDGALTVAVTNSPNSAMASASEFIVDIGAGPEVAVAATKSYSSTLMAIAALSAYLAEDDQMKQELSLAPEQVEATLGLEAQAKSLASELKGHSRCVVIGRGFNFATAHEWSLKLKELAYVVAEPYSSADFRHGPIALVDAGFPVLAIQMAGQAAPDVEELLQRLAQENKASIYRAGNVMSQGAGHQSFSFEASPEWLSPLASVVPGQLLAFHLAKARGFDPDNPRGLAKVTLTE